MASTYKVLGQSSPAATTDTSVYTVPTGNQSVVSTISVCNRASTAATFRIAIRVSGDSLTDNQYLYYDKEVGANDTLPISMGITLSAADIISVYASSADLSFNIFGTEIS